jgi:hypothetical protein
MIWRMLRNLHISHTTAHELATLWIKWLLWYSVMWPFTRKAFITARELNCTVLLHLILRASTTIQGIEASVTWWPFCSLILLCRRLQARFHGRENRLVPSSCLFVRPHVSARLPLDGFPWNLIRGTCMKICRENSHLVKIGEKYRNLYVKNQVRFVVSASMISP